MKNWMTTVFLRTLLNGVSLQVLYDSFIWVFNIATVRSFNIMFTEAERRLQNVMSYPICFFQYRNRKLC
jgi:hypothetical protein